MVRIIHLLVSALPLIAATGAAPAADPKIVLFEDPTLNASRLHYPLLIAEERGYRIRCDEQTEEQAIIRGLGFGSVPSEIRTAVDPEIVAAAPAANPLLCPTSDRYPIKVFAHDGGAGLTYYLQFPTDFGSTTFSDRLYIPGCAALAEGLKLNLDEAINADPTPFFPGKIDTIACLSGTPLVDRLDTFAKWCIKDFLDIPPAVTLEALLALTPEGVSAQGDPAACARAQEFLMSSTTLDLAGQRLTNLEPLTTLPHLTSLSLAGNEITDTSALAKLTALTFLDLSHNRVTNINALALLKNLTDAELGSNQIEDLRPLASARALTRLGLADNQIVDTSTLRFLQELTTLNLSRNRIDDARPLKALTKLTDLNLRRNRLGTVQSVNDVLQYKPSLDGNPVCISRPDQATTAHQKIFEACITAIKEGQVVLANMQTGKCLSVADERSDNNAPVVQFDCDSEGWRLWRLVETADGFQVQNVQTDKCLTIAGGVSTANSLPTVQFNCDSHASRQWKVTATGDGFRVENLLTEKCLTIAGGVSTENGVAAVQFDCDRHPSRFWSIRAAEPEVMLVNRQTGKCLAVADGRTDNNAPTAQFDCDGNAWQLWKLIDRGGKVEVKSVRTGKCLTIAGGVSTDNNIPALQFNCDGDPSRYWKLVDTRSGWQAENVQTGKCLTIAGGLSTENNVPAVQFTCDRDASRFWSVNSASNR